MLSFVCTRSSIIFSKVNDGVFFGTIFLLSCFYLSYRFQFFEGVWIGMIGFYIIKTGIYKYYSVGALTSNLD